MSTYSHEHHVRAPQHAVLELMETFFRAQGCLSFDAVPLPQEGEACEAFISADIAATYHAHRDGFVPFSFVVSPTDAHGWTILWGDTYARYHEELLAFQSAQLQTTALYGHENDQVDNWRWVLFEQGKEVASYWYLGQEDQRWYDWPEEEPRPPGALTLQEAFATKGRPYYHLSLYLAVSVGWSKTSLPLEQFRFVSVTTRRDQPMVQHESRPGEAPADGAL